MQVAKTRRLGYLPTDDEAFFEGKLNSSLEDTWIVFLEGDGASEAMRPRIEEAEEWLHKAFTSAGVTGYFCLAHFCPKLANMLGAEYLPSIVKVEGGKAASIFVGIHNEMQVEAILTVGVDPT